MPTPRMPVNPAPARQPNDIDPVKRKAVTDAASAAVAKALGVQPAAIPKVTKDQLAEAVNAAIDQRVTAYVSQTAKREVATTLWSGNDLAQRIADIAKLAKDSASSIVSNADFIKSLEEGAKIQKAKFDAYVKAGFGKPEAFELLKAEMYAKSKLRP